MNEVAAYCRNCDSPVEGKFCSVCGQRTSVHRVTFKETFQDFWDFVFSVNAPLFTTLKGLFLNPGKVLREYLSGKRKRYYRPVAFFIITTIVYLLVRSLLKFDPFSDSTIQVQGEDFEKLTNARNFMLLNIDKLLFIFVFTLACWLKLFFYRKYSLAEFIVVAFYLCGIYTILVTINMFYLVFLGDDQFGALLLMWIYFIYAIVSFFRRKKILNAFKALVIYFLGFFTYVAGAFALSYFIVSFT